MPSGFVRGTPLGTPLRESKHGASYARAWARAAGLHATGARAAGEPKNGGLRSLSWRAPNVSDDQQQEPNPNDASQANSRRGKVVRNLRISFLPQRLRCPSARGQ